MTPTSSDETNARLSQLEQLVTSLTQQVQNLNARVVLLEGQNKFYEGVIAVGFCFDCPPLPFSHHFSFDFCFILILF
jgi:hypothetical protein